MAPLKPNNIVFEAAEELTADFRMEAGLYSAILFIYLFIYLNLCRSITLFIGTKMPNSFIT